MSLFKHANTAVTLFWKPNDTNGYLSQWFMSPFELDGVEYCCAEQAMMAGKARMFGDTAAETKIMKTRSPTMMKRYGRKVTNFEEKQWVAKREELIAAISEAKFSQSPRLTELLLETGRGRIAEASPYDKIWGIGMKESHKNSRSPSYWRGLNLLGKALERTRSVLHRSSHTQADRDRFQATCIRVEDVLDSMICGYSTTSCSDVAATYEPHPYADTEIGLGEENNWINFHCEDLTVYPHDEVDDFIAHINKIFLR